MDRQEAALVVVGVESDSCWRPCTTSRVSSMSNVTEPGGFGWLAQ
jgi:hypothetical protein